MCQLLENPYHLQNVEAGNEDVQSIQTIAVIQAAVITTVELCILLLYYMNCGCSSIIVMYLLTAASVTAVTLVSVHVHVADYVKCSQFLSKL